MRILIDGMNLALEKGTGVATYARNLSYCLKRSGHEVVALYGKSVPRSGDAVLREAMFFDNPQIKTPVDEVLKTVADGGLRALRPARPTAVPETGYVIREGHADRLPEADAFLNYRNLFRVARLHFQLTGRFLEVSLPAPVDIAHWTYPIPIRARNTKNIYTIHDLVPLALPHSTLDKKQYYYKLVKKIAEEADHVVTVSDWSQRDIIGMLPIGTERVTNTYQSVEIPAALLGKSSGDLEVELANAFHAPLGEAANQVGAAGHGLQRNGFYLFVGAIEPKKNLRRMIEGYLASGVPEPLVVVGCRAWNYKEVVNMMARSPRVIYLDYLPFSQVITLMRTARALIFPSLYEGFGLPILEAFICGAPVITSDASSTSEIADDAALLTDPYDVRTIRDCIRALSAPDSDARRGEMAARGQRRAKAFGQALVSDRLDNLYRRVAFSETQKSPARRPLARLPRGVGTRATDHDPAFMGAAPDAKD